jgi:hypothetical protein
VLQAIATFTYRLMATYSVHCAVTVSVHRSRKRSGCRISACNALFLHERACIVGTSDTFYTMYAASYSANHMCMGVPTSIAACWHRDRGHHTAAAPSAMFHSKVYSNIIYMLHTLVCILVLVCHGSIVAMQCVALLRRMIVTD